MTNYKPHADARDKAFWSRACLIEFGLRFIDDPKAPNERLADTALRDTLKQECSGILAWLVRGCLAWQEQGLSIPESVRLATDRYRDEEDKLLLFMQECCLIKPEATVKAGTLFEAYRAWYDANHFSGRGMNGRAFGEEMSKRFTRVEVNGRRMYRGIGLLAPDDDPPTLFVEGKNGRGSVEGGRGSVEGAFSTSTSDNFPSQANLLDLDDGLSRGCRGSEGSFPINQQMTPL